MYVLYPPSFYRDDYGTRYVHLQMTRRRGENNGGEKNRLYICEHRPACATFVAFVRRRCPGKRPRRINLLPTPTPARDFLSEYSAVCLNDDGGKTGFFSHEIIYATDDRARRRRQTKANNIERGVHGALYTSRVCTSSLVYRCFPTENDKTMVLARVKNVVYTRFESVLLDVYIFRHHAWHIDR